MQRYKEEMYRYELYELYKLMHNQKGNCSKRQKVAIYNIDKDGDLVRNYLIPISKQCYDMLIILSEPWLCGNDNYSNMVY